jgi:hypothetical protein
LGKTFATANCRQYDCCDEDEGEKMKKTILPVVAMMLLVAVANGQDLRATLANGAAAAFLAG